MHLLSRFRGFHVRIFHLQIPFDPFTIHPCSSRRFDGEWKSDIDILPHDIRYIHYIFLPLQSSFLGEKSIIQSEWYGSLLRTDRAWKTLWNSNWQRGITGIKENWKTWRSLQWKKQHQTEKKSLLGLILLINHVCKVQVISGHFELNGKVFKKSIFLGQEQFEK
jgi:hypothetical protein